jgi:hypothetical protein
MQSERPLLKLPTGLFTVDPIPTTSKLSPDGRDFSCFTTNLSDASEVLDAFFSQKLEE